jgi:hypothetical protein
MDLSEAQEISTTLFQLVEKIHEARHGLRRQILDSEKAWMVRYFATDDALRAIRRLREMLGNENAKENAKKLTLPDHMQLTLNAAMAGPDRLGG